MLERPCSIISIPISINFDEEFESDAEDQIRKDDSMFHRKKIVFECLFEPEEPEPYLSRSDHRILNQQNRSQKALPQQQPQRPQQIQQPQQQQQPQLALSTGRIEPLPLYRKSLVSFDLSQPQPPSKSLTQSLPPLPPKSLSSTLPRPKSIIKNARGPFPQQQQQQQQEKGIFSQQQARKSTSSILKNSQSKTDFTGHQRSISTMSVNRNFQHLTTFNGQCNTNEAARYGTSAKRANIDSPLTKSAVTLNFSLDKPQPLPKMEEIKQPMTRSTREPLAESTTDDEKSNNGALIEQIFRDLLYLYMIEKHI